jgi:Sugar (and other) transporter
MIPGMLLFLGMNFLPESPRWLCRKERYEEAHHILALVHGHGDENHSWVLKEFEEIKEQAELDRQNADVTYWELLGPKYLNQTHIAVFTQIWSQLTGVSSKSL